MSSTGRWLVLNWRWPEEGPLRTRPLRWSKRHASPVDCGAESNSRSSRVEAGIEAEARAGWWGGGGRVSIQHQRTTNKAGKAATSTTSPSLQASIPQPHLTNSPLFPSKRNQRPSQPHQLTSRPARGSSGSSPFSDFPSDDPSALPAIDPRPASSRCSVQGASLVRNTDIGSVAIWTRPCKPWFG